MLREIAYAEAFQQSQWPSHGAPASAKPSCTQACMAAGPSPGRHALTRWWVRARPESAMLLLLLLQVLPMQPRAQLPAGAPCSSACPCERSWRQQASGVLLQLGVSEMGKGRHATGSPGHAIHGQLPLKCGALGGARRAGRRAGPPCRALRGVGCSQKRCLSPCLLARLG